MTRCLDVEIFTEPAHRGMLMPMTNDAVDRIRMQWAREARDVDTSGMAVIGRISRASRVLEKALQPDYATFGLQAADFDVMASLRRSGAPYRLTPTRLYRSMMISSGTMTNRLDRLERLGFIERNPDPDDRRGVLVGLTATGKNVIDRALRSHCVHENRLLSGLTDGEQEQLAALLRKLLLSFDDGGDD